MRARGGKSFPGGVPGWRDGRRGDVTGREGQCSGSRIRFLGGAPRSGVWAAWRLPIARAAEDCWRCGYGVEGLLCSLLCGRGGEVLCTYCAARLRRGRRGWQSVSSVAGTEIAGWGGEMSDLFAVRSHGRRWRGAARRTTASRSWFPPHQSLDFWYASTKRSNGVGGRARVGGDLLSRNKSPSEGFFPFYQLFHCSRLCFRLIVCVFLCFLLLVPVPCLPRSPWTFIPGKQARQDREAVSQRVLDRTPG